MAMNDYIQIIDLKKAIHLDGNTLNQISRPGMVLLPYFDVLKEQFSISKYRNSDIYCGQINDVTLVLNKYFFRNKDRKLIHGGLTYSDNTIIDENIDPFGFNRGRELVSGNDYLKYDELRIGETENIDDPSAIWIGGQTTPEPFFGHWLHEHLAKFIILEKMGILNGTIYLNATLPKRYLNWIPLVTKGNWQFKFVEKNSNLTFSKIFIPTTVNYRSRYNYQITMWLHGLIDLRKRLVKNIKVQDIKYSKSDLPRALYIQRNSKWRNITNEGDVINCLKQFFQIDIISFENFLPIEQIEIIRKYKSRNFSVGANLMSVGMYAMQKDFAKLEEMVHGFQQINMALRYSSIPVVTATQGYVFGGGCEVLMHTDAAVCHAESYIGLVEVGVGLIPGGGGTKEFALRASNKFFEGDIQIPTLLDKLKVIAMASVSTSAIEAFDYGYLLHERDHMELNLSRVLSAAKQKVTELAAHYTAPVRRDAMVLGRMGLATLYTAINEFYLGKFMTEYDQEIARKIAYVLCGGDLTAPQKVSEQYLLDLEKEAFLQLLGNQKTLDRIQYLLMNNKPLRN